MNGAVREFLDASAIARWLQLSVDRDAAGALYRLAFHERHIGNPAIRAIHGGVIASFLEVAAQCALIEAAGKSGPVDTVNVDIDYVRSSRPQDMLGRARVTRLGRRIAFIEATGWQEAADRPVAIARFRMRPPG